MALVYANECVSYRIVEALRSLGHDVLTSREAGNAGHGLPDEEVLAFAHSSGRVVVTNNERDFLRLHRDLHSHAGIVGYRIQSDSGQVAHGIHNALADPRAIGGFFARVRATGYSILA